eukprot:TRINITY_DN1180_c0_g1_i3.p3 TRINITY_DN1180_c0_g1~~TRINITY_DN1180_c0_g1_i3.p3  ORF type:complete len:143 (-),score=31.67 TRINITY_DN1180_c0_g1_i3:321-749(-)
MSASVKYFMAMLVVCCALFGSANAQGSLNQIASFLQNLPTKFDSNFGDGFFGNTQDTGNAIDLDSELDTFTNNVAKAYGVGSIANSGELEIRPGSRAPGGVLEVSTAIDGGNNFAICRPFLQCLANSKSLVVYVDELPGRGN